MLFGYLIVEELVQFGYYQQLSYRLSAEKRDEIDKIQVLRKIDFYIKKYILNYKKIQTSKDYPVKFY